MYSQERGREGGGGDCAFMVKTKGVEPEFCKKYFKISGGQAHIKNKISLSSCMKLRRANTNKPVLV